MNFTIDEQYLTDVVVRSELSLLECPDDPTPDDLVRILNDRDKIVTTHSQDHPEFARLRNQLEELGYIQTVRNCWNGDTILKPFSLNGWRFKKGHRFPCAAALKNSIACARKYGWKNISSL